MSELTPLAYSQNVQPFYVAEAGYTSDEQYNLLAFAGALYYWHIQLLVFSFYFDVDDLTAGANLYTLDQFGVATQMVKLGANISVEDTNVQQDQTWTNETEFDTQSGFAMAMDGGASDSHCDLTIFGWKVLWTPDGL